ncbi:MAG TPA: hypothetical protein VM933_02080 [Acidimicrobiales bacterium]|nr:hypothetical protein [Acidimicrobiales bacterium]
MAPASENEVPSGGDDQSLKEKVKEVTGWATGDRKVEADGATEDEEQIKIEHGDKGIKEP